MTDKITLTNVGSIDTTLVNAINANNAILTTAMDNTLSRDGTSPNQMGANLDMNSNQILNLPAPATVNSPARLIDVVSNPSITIPPVLTGSGAPTAVATKGTLYLRTDGSSSSTRAYINTNGSTTWTNIVTAG